MKFWEVSAQFWGISTVVNICGNPDQIWCFETNVWCFGNKSDVDL